MHTQSRFVTEFGAAFGSCDPAETGKAVSMKPNSLALGRAASDMDSVISLTMIPEFDTDADLDADLSDDNLFGSDADLAEDGTAANFLRTTRRSQLEQSRIVALRRRAMRARLRSQARNWPLDGGQTDDALKAMRDYIYTPDETDVPPAPSTALRLATHTITLTLVATALPVGAAMMTYNILKGEDIRATARLTTLTGLALAILAGNPGLAAYIGA